MPILFILFLLIPLIEIYFLIKVGSVFGAGFTIFAVVATAVIGAALVRQQGISTWTRVQTQMAQANMPAIEMFEGIFILVSGALLLTPGFFTDALGFAFLIPPLRRWMIKRWFARGNLHSFGQGAGQGPGQGFGQPGTTANQQDEVTIIDVEYKEVDDR